MTFANFTIDETWEKGTGFTGYIDFKNFTPKDLNGWIFEFEAPFKITEIWDAQIIRKQGSRYTVRQRHWNRAVNSGHRVSFGFIGELRSGSIRSTHNQPRQFWLNGRQPSEPQTSPNPTTAGPAPDSQRLNYGEALQKSFLFYEAQRAGKLPASNRIDWRGDSVLDDGKDVGRDLSKGYFDAGDTVKFGMPMAASMTLLAWGGQTYRQAYRRSGQLDELLAAVKWGTDYLMNAHVTRRGKTVAFYGQVGLGDVDHAYRGRVENMRLPRPAFKIDAQNPGTDLAAEAAAALAAAAGLFRSTQPGYANRLIRHAKPLYAFADSYRGKYSDAIADADKFYKAEDGYEDELAWAATWLHKATGEQRYLRDAERHYDGVGWTQSWGDKNWGTSILLSQLKPNQTRYRRDSEQWLNNWVNGRQGVKYTPGGLAWITQWGSARMAANAAFLAGVYADTVTDPHGRYGQFAERQVDYLLGDNPQNFSYMVGFGPRYPKQPHHRNATGTANFETPADNRHILYGALVGGPTRPNDSAYRDSRSDYIANEVALDYNAGFTGAIARMYSEFGGSPLTNSQLDALPGITV